MLDALRPTSATFACAEDAALFARYRTEIDALFDQHIPRQKPVALLQFPYDGNVGNHMMWVATTDYLKSRKIPLAYVAHGGNFDVGALSRAVGDGPVLFLGGVTISKLWPRHAMVKRIVAENCRDNALVSLPATVLFSDDEDREQARTIFGDHPNVTVMARDPFSASQAREAFPEHVRVVTVPDVALRLDAQPRRGTPTHDIIWLARDDLEGVGTTPPPNVHRFDWPHDLRAYMPKSFALLRMSGAFSRARTWWSEDRAGAHANRMLARFYRAVAKSVLTYGNRVMDTGVVLVTDRMHPHVHAALRGQRVVLLPDKFGKNRTVYDNYTKSLSTVRWANTPAEALDLARSLVREASP